MGVNLPPLKLDYSPNQSPRGDNKVTLVVVHDTEGDYGGAISWLKEPQAKASAHVVLREDGDEATQLVSWGHKAWSCVDYNSITDNIEIAGHAAKGYPDHQLRRAARIVAFRLKKRGLPPNHVKPKHPGDGSRGFTYHSDLGEKGGGHTDPGFSKIRSLWFDLRVKFEYARGQFRNEWGEY